MLKLNPLQWSAVALCLTVSSAFCQPQSLGTPLLGGSGSKGCMFDVASLSASPITVRSFGQSFLGLGGASAEFEIWIPSAGGSFLPVQNQPTAWTRIAIGTVVTGPVGVATKIPFQVSVTIPPGGVQGFYLTSTNATPTNVSYTSAAGGLFGLPAASNSDLEIRIGVARTYPFGFSFSPRIWNGFLSYCIGTSCAPDYETNDANAALDVDGIHGNILVPAIAELCPQAPSVISTASIHAGLPFELILADSPLVRAFVGGLTTANGQALNISLTSASVFFLNGGVVPVLVPYPGSFSVPILTPSILGPLSIQQFNIDPAHPDGFALSQGCQINIQGGAPVLGPFGDDSALQLVLGSAPLCGPSTIPFYGTLFTSISVISNGRVLFGAPDVDFSPTVNEARIGAPFIGAWADFAPNLGGTIATSLPAPGTIRVAWQNVPYFGNPTLASGFAIEIDSGTGAMSLNGLSGLAPFPATVNTSNLMYLGISAGQLGAFDPGPTPFAPGPLSPTASGLGMLYTFGVAGTLAPSVSRIDFVPDAAGGYRWSAL